MPFDPGAEIPMNEPTQRGGFKIPTLRNIELTAPYMHSGTLATLEDVVAFYNQGGVGHDLKSPLLRDLGLSVQERNALVAFLRGLTGENVGELVLDAFAVEVGDVGLE